MLRPEHTSIRWRHPGLWVVSAISDRTVAWSHVRMPSWCRHLDALQPAAAKHCQVGSHLVLIDPASTPNSTESTGSWFWRSGSSACSPRSGYLPRFQFDDADAHCKDCFRLFCDVTTTSQHPAVCVSPSLAVTRRCIGADKAWLWKRHTRRTSGRSTRQAADGAECCSAANLQASAVRPCVTVTRGTALAASSRTYHYSVSSPCLSMSAQHGAAVPRRPAQLGEQYWSPAASTFVIVGRARCSSHQPRDHWWLSV